MIRRQVQIIWTVNLLACLLITALLCGCTSTPKTQHSIERIFSQNIHFRRPAGPGADAKAGPGGLDYTSNPLPNEQLDCQDRNEFFRELKLKDIRDCLTNTETPVNLLYRLRREPVPSFELQETQGLPDCVKQVLPMIPVPREIIFQSDEEGSYRCYSARLNIEANETLGSKIPLKTMEIKTTVQPESISTDDALLRLLQAWVLTPLRNNDNKAFNAKIVPEHLCRQCMTEKGMLKEKVSFPAYWP